MSRNMSFFLTTEQIRNRMKTVTRRLGWAQIQVGEIINACVKCQGLKKGEKIEVLCQIRITGKRQEHLNEITQKECVKEGFPRMLPSEFVKMFTGHMRCQPDIFVNRIEFEYLSKILNNRNYLKGGDVMVSSEKTIAKWKQEVNSLRTQELASQQNDLECFQAILTVLDTLKSKRPGDKSGRDRAYSVAITELEKVAGFFNLKMERG